MIGKRSKSLKNIGWILLFYLDENQILSENDRAEFPYLSWSPYDRLDIKKISDFNDFFENQYWMRKDCVAQQMHLIPEYPCEFGWSVSSEEGNKDKNKGQCLIRSNQSKRQFPLNCIVTTRFNKKLRNNKKLREKVYEELKQVKVINGLSLEWAAFNSLDSESIVFILLADDIETFAKFGEVLKSAKVKCEDKKEDLFSAVSSFVDFNMEGWMGDPKADLIVRLNLKSKEAYHSVVGRLMEEGILKKNIVNLFLGKCVLDVRVKSNESVLGYFQSDGIFNGESPFYKDYITSSRSYWCVEFQDVESFIITVDGSDLFHSEEKKIDDSADEKYARYPLLQFVLQEYRRLIKSEQCSSWAPVLYEQYKTVCKLVKDYVEMENRKQLYSLLKQLTNVLQHIRQACTPVAEIPYHNYTYSGSYNDILRMYYGVIATLFEVGFQMPHCDESQQHRIMFCVDFESAAEIHSSMYSSKGENNKEDERFIVFHLPFNSFANIESTVKLLGHEVFHYIAPYNRKQRNELLVESWTRTLLNRIVKYYTEEEVPSEVIELIMNQFWNCEQLYKDSYKASIKINSGIEGCILNDFLIKGESLYSLSRALGVVSDIAIRRIQEKIQEICSTEEEYIDLKDKLTQIEKAVRKKISSDITDKYIQTEIIKNAKAYKEVFCDLAMIHMFEMSVSDYISWFYEVAFKEFEESFKEMLNLVELESKNIRIMSFELRMCIIFDVFCGVDDPRISHNAFKEKTKKVLSEHKDTDGITGFVKYCDRFYSQYLTQKNLFRNLYQRFFNKTVYFWKDIPKTALSLVEELKKTTGINNKIDLSTDVVDLFISKNFVKEFKDKQENLVIENELVSSEKVKILGDLALGEEDCVTSIADYISKVCEKTRRMRRGSAVYGDFCWYRGICNEGHSLLPGLYRLYKNKEKNELIGMSPYVKQAEILKNAYYLTMNMPSLWTEQLQGIPEHMCCLQHYGMITNLLDFSLDMLVALHFALNPDNKRDKKELEEGKYFPKVVIFNPAKYNKAVMSLQAGRVDMEEKSKLPSPVLFDVCNEEMSEYFVGDMTPEKFSERNREFFEKNYRPSMRTNKYPVPVIIRQSNSRILAQNGIFLAYNLYAETDVEEHDFSYLDLREIQKEYLSLFEDKTDLDKEKFLEEIAIESSSIQSIQEELEILGVNTGKMYPELSKIFEENRRDE